MTEGVAGWYVAGTLAKFVRLDFGAAQRPMYRLWYRENLASREWRFLRQSLILK